jgi:hypothetical protein
MDPSEVNMHAGISNVDSGGSITAMRSAMYYPHITIQSENIIRTALLLWDQVHVIVPYSGFVPHYEKRPPEGI